MFVISEANIFAGKAMPDDFPRTKTFCADEMKPGGANSVEPRHLFQLNCRLFLRSILFTSALPLNKTLIIVPTTMNGQTSPAWRRSFVLPGRCGRARGG